MEKPFKSFEAINYQISSDRLSIKFNYKLNFTDGKAIKFVETITLPKSIPASIFVRSLTDVLDNLHIMLGISYFKLYCPKEIILPYCLTEEQILFWKIVYTKGLGEFYYRNRIDFRSLVNFSFIPNTKRKVLKSNNIPKKTLVMIGGGKDSIVAVETLKEQNKKTTGLVIKNIRDKSQIQKNVIKLMGIDYLEIARELDAKLFDKKNVPGSYDGHVPVSAIYAFIGLLVAISFGYSEIVTANEKSANVGNVDYLGMAVNHQWSKSEEFENLFQNYVAHYISPDINYYSILRSLTELQIAEKFIRHEKYFSFFSSCNKNFATSKKTNSKWCGECPKCVFVFLILAAFLPKEKLTLIFNKNLFDNEKLLPLFKDILGKGKMKPFECVGTFEEANTALQTVINRGEFKESVVIKILDDRS